MRKEKLKLIRRLYSYIYDWHFEVGKQKYIQRHEGRVSEDDRYISFLSEMHSPENAEIEMITTTAKEVMCGCMEWSCSERYRNEMTLWSIAEEIGKIINNLDEDSEDDVGEKLRQLVNVSEKGMIEPQVIKVRIPHQADLHGCYQHYANKAYSDVSSDFDNLGGQVVLADTNLEIEQSDHFREKESHNMISFRNSAAMNFVPITDEVSLISHIKSGKITIEHINIGVKNGLED